MLPAAIALTGLALLCLLIFGIGVTRTDKGEPPKGVWLIPVAAVLVMAAVVCWLIHWFG